MLTRTRDRNAVEETRRLMVPYVGRHVSPAQFAAGSRRERRSSERTTALSGPSAISHDESLDRYAEQLERLRVDADECVRHVARQELHEADVAVLVRSLGANQDFDLPLGHLNGNEIVQ